MSPNLSKRCAVARRIWPLSSGEARRTTIHREHTIAALVPAYNEAMHVGGVLQTMPAFVDHIIVIDDASIDGTADVAAAVNDDRVRLIRHKENRGLGASLIDAHLAAIDLGADISVVMAGDGQMDPDYLTDLLDPIVDGRADFTKGNRFYSVQSFDGMPGHRVFGNVLLSFMTKLATGYWNLFDPQNGYTAISKPVQSRIPWTDLARDYTFENDVLARLGLMRARVLDVDIPAAYGDEVSDIKLATVVPSLFGTLSKAAWRRFWLQYVVRSFSPVAVFLLSGLMMLVWAAVYGSWVVWQTVGPAVATTGTVMLVVLPFLVGFQLVLAALVIDILNTVK